MQNLLLSISNANSRAGKKKQQHIRQYELYACYIYDISIDVC